MAQSILRFISVFVFITSVSTVFADSATLWSAYQDAVKNDPIFQQEKAVLQQTEQSIPVSRSYLLPQLILNAQASGTSQDSTLNGHENYNSNQYGISFSQAIFNASAFAQLKQSQKSVQAAALLFSAQTQDLMVRFTRSYLATLQAKDLWVATKQQEKFSNDFLKMVARKYELKFATITEMDQARQQYNLFHSQTINAKISYEQSLQNLSNITAVAYSKINAFQSNFQVKKIDPQNKEQWVALSKKQNLFLLSSQLSMQAAEANLSIKRSDFLPSVSAIANYTNTNEVSSGLNDNIRATVGGVSASWNLVQGGLSIAELRQAKAVYAQASAQVQQRYLEAITSAENAYFGVTQGADSYAASHAAVAMGADGLTHTTKGFKAGVQTIFDLLQAQNRFFDAQKQDIQNFYQYILNTVLLKQAAGTLSPEDLNCLSRYTEKKGK